MNPSSFWVLIFPFQWISQCYVARCSSWQPSLRHSFFLQNQKFPVNKCFLPCDVVCWMFITVLVYWILTPTMWKTHTFCVFGHACSYILLAPALPKILAPLYHLFGNSSYVASTWTCRKSHHYVEKHLDDTALNLHTPLHTSSRRPCSASLLPAESRKRTKSTSTCVHGLVVDSLDISSVKGNSLWLFATEVRIIMKNDDPYLDSTGMRFWSVWRGWKPARISSHMKSQKARFLGKTAVQISIFDRMFELSHLLPLSFVHGLGVLLLRPSC